jgi:hypothetical protein
MHRNRTWSFALPEERIRNRTLPIEGGDGSTLTLDFTTGVLDQRLTFTRSSTATYIGADGLVKTMDAAPTNDPTKARFDHDPTTLAPRGLLIEGSASNLALYSQSFTGGIVWFFTGTGTKSTTNNYATAPDGTTTAARLQLGQNCALKQNAGATGVNHTVSIWVKSNTGSNQTIAFWTGTAAANRTATTSWTRIEAVVNNASAALFDLYNPNATDCDILIWGAQLETGSGASSYIPTGASTGTRNPDYCVMDGISSFFTSQSSLTMLVDATPRFQSGFPALWRLTDAGNANSYELYYTSSGTNNTYATKVAVGGVSSGESNFANSIAQNTRQIMGYAIASGVGFRSRNGVSASAQIPTSLPSAALTRLGIGSSGLSANPSTAHIRRIKYWPYAMTQDQLNGVTTP